MLDLFAITAPIFLLIGVGYAAVRFGIVRPSHVEGLAAFVLYVALPALIIDATATRPFADLFDGRYILAYAAGSLATFGLVFALARFVMKRALTPAAIVALGASASNSGFIGYPVAVLAVGEIAAIGLALNMMVENLLMIPLALALAESGQGAGEGGRTGEGRWAGLRRTLGTLSRNPILIAIVVGMALSVSGVRLPGVIAQALSMMADASAPAALFVIGAALVGLKLNGLAGEVAAIAAAKLMLHPLMVLAAFALFPGVDPALAAVGILLASVPMMSIYPIVGARFGLERLCAAALMVATLAAFLTVTVFVGLVAGR